MSGRSPPLYCTLILITMHSHQSYLNITTVIHSYLIECFLKAYKPINKASAQTTGGKMSKVFLGGNIGCRDKSSQWYLMGSPICWLESKYIVHLDFIYLQTPVFMNVYQSQKGMLQIWGPSHYLWLVEFLYRNNNTQPYSYFMFLYSLYHIFAP